MLLMNGMTARSGGQEYEPATSTAGSGDVLGSSSSPRVVARPSSRTSPHCSGAWSCTLSGPCLARWKRVYSGMCLSSGYLPVRFPREFSRVSRPQRTEAHVCEYQEGAVHRSSGWCSVDLFRGSRR